MKKLPLKPIFFLIGLMLFLGNFFIAPKAQAALELIKAQGQSAVYYLDSRGARHPFPNGITFKSWYGDSFSKVITVSADLIKTYPLGKNITIRPGAYLVKITTAPQVYAVEQGGVLREIINEDIAEAIYGKDWQKKVVDIPDVFFENYVIGEPLKHDYTIPNGILFQDKATKKYYYKANNDILQPFESAEAVLANNFRLNDAIVSSRSFYIREKPIKGLDKNIFNLTAQPVLDRRDCENKKLKAAVIFLADKEYLGPEIEAVQKIKEKIPARFAEATNGLSALDVSYPAIIQLDDGYLLKKKNDGTTEIKNEAINTFYDNNPDEFDFIFLWSNFKLPSEDTNEIAHFVAVTNKLEGIGRAMIDRASVYGSQGKLKGVITLGNINKYETQTSQGLNEALNIVMHEVLHQWSAYIGFGRRDERISYDLLRPEDLSHWNYYAGFISPLGGSGWQDNGDGTFTSDLSKMTDANLRNYSPLDLYLMGLIPYQLMAPVSYIVPKVEGALGNTLEATARTVTIEQIIKANGKVQCSLD